MERGGDAIYREILHSNYEYTYTSQTSISYIVTNEQYRLQEEAAGIEINSVFVCVTRALVYGQVYPVVLQLDLQPDCVALRRVYRVFSPLKYRNAVFGRVSRKHRCKVHPDSIIYSYCWILCFVKLVLAFASFFRLILFKI